MSIALVTGASRGLELATARALAKTGRSVILTGRDNNRTGAPAAALREEGLDVQAMSLDVEDPSSSAAAATQVKQKHGRLDVLVNNAGVLPEATDTAIKVTSVCPGFVQTDLTPINREQAPLTADQASAVILTAATLPPDASSGTFIDRDGPVAW